MLNVQEGRASCTALFVLNPATPRHARRGKGGSLLLPPPESVGIPPSRPSGSGLSVSSALSTARETGRASKTDSHDIEEQFQMISKISIKNAASYGPSREDLVPLKKVNFVYGSNASGKTTISRIISDPNSAEFSECDLNWEDDVVLDAMVYNRDFVEENFDEPDELKRCFHAGKEG